MGLLRLPSTCLAFRVPTQPRQRYGTTCQRPLQVCLPSELLKQLATFRPEALQSVSDFDPFERVRQESWQRIGGASLPRGKA
jgi:hypothetical protein